MGDTVFEQAFLDRHSPRLSVFVARLITPRDILSNFCSFTYARKLVSGRKPEPEDLLDYGEGIAVISAADVMFTLGLTFAGDAGDPNEINRRGHTNILNGQHYAIDLAELARPLKRDEILGG